MLLFDLDSGHRSGGAPVRGLCERLASTLDTEVALHEWRDFEDGEFKVRPLADPRGEDVYVVQGLHGGPHRSAADKLLGLLMFIAALKDHGAARVTAVVPYLAYMRKDRRTQPFDPVSSRYLAQLFESVGTGQLIALEPHNPAAFDNAFRCPVRALPGHGVFDPVLDELRGQAIAVASPDPGGVKRAQLWREHAAARLRCDVGFAFVDKRRAAGQVSGGECVAGEVDGQTVLLVDDLVASGHTLLRAARALRDRGARRIVACASHGLFVQAADHSLGDPVIDMLAVSDSVPAFRVGPGSPLHPRLRVLSCVPLLADAIRDSHAAFVT